MVRLAVLLASLGALLAAAAWALHQRQPEIVGYNGARPFAFVATVAPGKPVCTGLGAARTPPESVRITVGTNGNGEQPLRIRVPGAGQGPVQTARDGVNDLVLPDGAGEGSAGEACLVNVGRRPLLVAGEPGAGSRIRGRPQKYTVSYELVDRTPPRWSADAGDALSHVGLARAGAGGTATGYVVFVLLGLALVGALVAAFRWAR